jgi:hypothetical protein
MCRVCGLREGNRLEGICRSSILYCRSSIFILRYQSKKVVLVYKLKHMKTQTIKSVEQDIQLYEYWIGQCKKVLRVAKEYGLSENEIRQNGNSLKRLRLKLKQKKTILNNIKNYL